jgi:hypothetical protein
MVDKREIKNEKPVKKVCHQQNLQINTENQNEQKSPNFKIIRYTIDGSKTTFLIDINIHTHKHDNKVSINAQDITYGKQLEQVK